MKRMVILILILSSFIAGCGGQAAPAPTAAPQATPTRAQSTAPTTAAPPAAPTRLPAVTQTTAPATPAAQSPTQPAAGGVLRFELFLTIYDMRPSEMTVKVGQKVHWVITNEDTEEHDLVSAGAKLKSILVEGKRTVEVDWTAPDTPGTYEAICTIHREIKPLIIKVVP